MGGHYCCRSRRQIPQPRSGWDWQALGGWDAGSGDLSSEQLVLAARSLLRAPSLCAAARRAAGLCGISRARPAVLAPASGPLPPPALLASPYSDSPMYDDSYVPGFEDSEAVSAQVRVGVGKWDDTSSRLDPSPSSGL